MRARRLLLLSILLIGQASFARGLPASFFDVARRGCELDLRAEVASVQIDLERVTLRPARPSDRGDIVELTRDREISALYLHWPQWTPGDARGYFEHRMLPVLQVEADPRLEGSVRAMRLVIEDRDGHEVLGLVNLRRAERTGIWEVGYALERAARGRGYGTEALGGILERIEAFDVAGLVEAVPRRDNVASLGLLKKLGFREAAEGALSGEMAADYVLYRRYANDR